MKGFSFSLLAFIRLFEGAHHGHGGKHENAKNLVLMFASAYKKQASRDKKTRNTIM